MGQPLSQWAIPGACTVAALMLVRHPGLRRVLAVASIVLGFVLSFHYSAEVQGPTWVGLASPDPRYRVGPVQPEWHSWLTGLYRRE